MRMGLAPSWLFARPNGNFTCSARIGEKTFVPLITGELLTACQSFEANPGVPQNEIKPLNCFAVGRLVEREYSFVIVMRPSEPMLVLTLVEMGTPRCDCKL